jgi:predicted nucleic acid-binding protein
MIVYLDTNIVIYFVERNPTWWPKVTARLARFRASKEEFAVGDLSRAECLVGPFKAGNEVLEASYRAFFADPDIRVLPMTAIVCERAARIRAVYRYDLPDALHLATAVEHGCGLFFTNDGRLARCKEITVEVLT